MRARKEPLSSSVSSFLWNGHRVYFRPGSSDIELIYRVLLKPEKKREYQIPPLVFPSIILDIGANIGAATLLFAKAFPNSMIYAFEPVPENVEILRLNTKELSQVKILPFGLGSEDATLDMYRSDNPSNFGGFSLFERGVDPGKKITIHIRNAQQCLRELEIHSADLIKIDTEGSEFAILTALDPDLLQTAKAVLGELHGERDQELVTYLAKWFHVNWRKNPGDRLSHFTAARIS